MLDIPSLLVEFSIFSEKNCYYFGTFCRIGKLYSFSIDLRMERGCFGGKTEREKIRGDRVGKNGKIIGIIGSFLYNKYIKWKPLRVFFKVKAIFCRLSRAPLRQSLTRLLTFPAPKLFSPLTVHSVFLFPYIYYVMFFVTQEFFASPTALTLASSSLWCSWIAWEGSIQTLFCTRKMFISCSWPHWWSP